MKEYEKKFCIKCGKEIIKPYSCSVKNWKKRKWCSKDCIKNQNKDERETF